MLYKPKPENVALFDLDGTLCDYDLALKRALKKLRAPGEPDYASIIDAPRYVQNRADLIRSMESWWVSIPKFQLGWDVLDVAKALGYDITILTQGPRRNPASWSGKKRWIDKHLGPDVKVTITRDKGSVYGKVLVDDFPEYIKEWLEWRERGLVIMPANASNAGFRHRQVIRYDGTNLDEVRRAMKKARLR